MCMKTDCTDIVWTCFPCQHGCPPSLACSIIGIGFIVIILEVNIAREAVQSTLLGPKDSAVMSQVSPDWIDNFEL